jgi:hypothetical protein
MENAKKRPADDASMGRYEEERPERKPATYDPDDQMPDTTIAVGQGHRDVPLEQSDPDKGYSANNGGQGSWESTLPLADEDMDRRVSDKGQNEGLKDSYELMQKNKDKEEG